MMEKKALYRKLGGSAGWISAIAFVVGVVAAFTDQEIAGLPGNDWWQASLYLVLFAIFANFAAKD